MAVVTPTERPKSVRNRSVMELFVGVLCVVSLLFDISVGITGFCHMTESDIFLFNCITLCLQSSVEKQIQIIFYIAIHH